MATIRYVVDGHEFDNEESDLLGDGQFPPFRIFDVQKQRYIDDNTYKTRDEATKIANILNDSDKALDELPTVDDLQEKDSFGPGM